MVKSSIHKFANDIGFDIANSDDDTQALLINGFCRGLRSSMRDRDLEMQLCYICQHLDNNSYEILKALVEFCELKNNSK